MTSFNIYCDESCHLEHDLESAMVIGAVWCPQDKSHESAERIREIKARHGLPRWFEVKWTKVSPSKQQLYLDLVDYFFDDDDLRFRAVVVPDKKKLRHEAFNQDHDTFYYKMYYTMLKTILSPDDRYSIYLDIKDTKSHPKEVKLQQVLCNSLYDRDRDVVTKLQSVHSREVEQVQLADLLIGAVGYANRDLASSAAKLRIVERIRKRSGYQLTRSTLMRAEKFNLLRWQAQ